MARTQISPSPAGLCNSGVRVVGIHGIHGIHGINQHRSTRDELCDAWADALGKGLAERTLSQQQATRKTVAPRQQVPRGPRPGSSKPS
jgi:hypothetical protein